MWGVQIGKGGVIGSGRSEQDQPFACAEAEGWLQSLGAGLGLPPSQRGRGGLSHILVELTGGAQERGARSLGSLPVTPGAPCERAMCRSSRPPWGWSWGAQQPQG